MEDKEMGKYDASSEIDDIKVSSIDLNGDGNPDVVSAEISTEDGKNIKTVAIDIDGDGDIDVQVVSIDSVSQKADDNSEVSEDTGVGPDEFVSSTTNNLRNEITPDFELDEEVEADGVEFIEEDRDVQENIQLADMYDSGIADTVLVDVDGDGIVDEEHTVEIVDVDDDGFGDQVVDSYTGEVIAEDSDHDGVIDVMDKDGDGYMEDVSGEENIDGHLTVDQEREDYFVDGDSSSAVGWYDQDEGDGIHAEWDENNDEIFVPDGGSFDGVDDDI